MKDYLLSLAVEILRSAPSGLSKVKFAKIIYFTHKGLVLKGVVPSRNLEFIRMPLGPVPDGFMELDKNPVFSVQYKQSSLAYNSRTYFLKNRDVSTEGIQFPEEIRQLVQQLNRLSTGDLVEKSHQEPSWKKIGNGMKFFISPEDLRIPLPSGTQLIAKEDDNKLQRNLVEGMITEIVSDSTSLEYPAK